MVEWVRGGGGVGELREGVQEFGRIPTANIHTAVHCYQFTGLCQTDSERQPRRVHGMGCHGAVLLRDRVRKQTRARQTRAEWRTSARWVGAEEG